MSQHHPILNPPNILTLFRVACIPLMVVLLFSPSREACFWAAWVFALASATDWFDGHLARRMGIETVFGKFLDPIADKLIVTAALIMILPFGRVPAWMVFVVLAREIVITGLRSIASSEGIVIQASDLGKYKTIFQLTAIIGLLLHYDYNWLFGIAHPLLTVNMHNAGMFFFWIAFVLTVWSGVDYLAKFIKVIAR
ncbi:CDP-diacylglycerol--glycerol-3-phosphate 3-phosphatidyltransferase [Trichlorobacter lovleyi]|uniref:CDP-diacylglycerol--glycerol-3-phosphate 3-phosphatidyltransferase n=1 Tax=Trichlorobacter lovleyi TaxID=313985 RepID=UPI003D12FC1A